MCGCGARDNDILHNAERTFHFTTLFFNYLETRQKKNYRICSRDAHKVPPIFIRSFFSFRFCVNRVCSIHSLFPQARLNGNFSRTISWANATCSASYKICASLETVCGINTRCHQWCVARIAWWNEFMEIAVAPNEMWTKYSRKFFRRISQTRALRWCREAYIAICMLVVAKTYVQWNIKCRIDERDQNFENFRVRATNISHCLFVADGRRCKKCTSHKRKFGWGRSTNNLLSERFRSSWGERALIRATDTSTTIATHTQQMTQIQLIINACKMSHGHLRLIDLSNFNKSKWFGWVRPIHKRRAIRNLLIRSVILFRSLFKIYARCRHVPAVHACCLQASGCAPGFVAVVLHSSYI